MHYIYILKSLNKGQVKSTAHRRPLKIIYKETVKTFAEAHKRELEIKRMKGGIQIKRLLEHAGVAQW